MFNVPANRRHLYGAAVGAALPFVLYGGIGAALVSRVTALSNGIFASLMAPVADAEPTLLGKLGTSLLWAVVAGVSTPIFFNFIEGDSKLKSTYAVSATAVIASVVLGSLGGLQPALTAFFMCIALGNAYVDALDSRGYFSFYPVEAKVRPSDLAGQSDLIGKLSSKINSYLSEHYTPRILLSGPPGTGKSALVEAMAYELKRPIIKVTNAQLHAADPADREDRIKEIFRKAREAKAVILFEEFDVIGRDRTEASDNQVRDEVTSLMHQLDLLNAKDPANNIVIFATTNYQGAIDSAVIRPGRFDFKHAVVPLNEKGIEEVIERYIGRYQLDAEDALDVKAKFPNSASPADIENYCRNLSLTR